MTCIYCKYEIEEQVPGHEFMYDEVLGKIVHFHEECVPAEVALHG